MAYPFCLPHPEKALPTPRPTYCRLSNLILGPTLISAPPEAPPTHLLVRVHVDMALDALLPHVGPGVPAHPFSLALGTLVLSKAALLALVRCQALTFGACLEDRK